MNSKQEIKTPLSKLHSTFHSSINLYPRKVHQQPLNTRNYKMTILNLNSCNDLSTLPSRKYPDTFEFSGNRFSKQKFTIFVCKYLINGKGLFIGFKYFAKHLKNSSSKHNVIGVSFQHGCECCSHIVKTRR